MKTAVALTCALLFLGSAGASVTREDTTLEFGEFISQAQWTYPGLSQGKLPAVLLIHGSTPADMDFTVMGDDNTVRSHILRDIADALGERGIATLRYNKRFVSGPGQVDHQRFATTDLRTFLTDAETALAAMKQNPQVDPQRIFVYGWSEGSTVAAQLVRQHPEVRGLILQGPVVLPWAELFDKQLTQVQLPYLRQLAPGGLTQQNFRQSLNSAPGIVAQNAIFFALDPAGLARNEYSLNPVFDLNKNSVIELDSEYLPGAREVLKYLINEPQGYLNLYSAKRALPDVTAQVPFLKTPLLVLQGMNDANTPEPYLSRLQDALIKAKLPATILRYPGLGHSLGPASSVFTDDFRPIAQRPLNDMADWVLKH